MCDRRGTALPESTLTAVKRPCEGEVRRRERPEDAGVRFTAERGTRPTDDA